MAKTISFLLLFLFAGTASFSQKAKQEISNAFISSPDYKTEAATSYINYNY